MVAFPARQKGPRNWFLARSLAFYLRLVSSSAIIPVAQATQKTRPEKPSDETPKTGAQFGKMNGLLFNFVGNSFHRMWIEFALACRAILFIGNKHVCPCCGRKFRAFTHGGSGTFRLRSGGEAFAAAKPLLCFPGAIPHLFSAISQEWLAFCSHRSGAEKETTKIRWARILWKIHYLCEVPE